MALSKSLFALLVLVLFPVSVWAQRPPQAAQFSSSSDTAVLQAAPISNPSTIEFVSTDHNATDGGQAVITGYDLVVTLVGATAPAKTLDIGKPASTTTTVTYPQFGTVWAGLPAGSYTTVVVAKGSGGTVASAASDPFLVAPRVPAAPSKPIYRQ